MRKFVNIFILVFLLDAVISLADVLIARWFGAHPLRVVRGLVAFVPFILAFPLYLIMGCMRGFPRWVVLPFVLFVAWVSLFIALPLPFFVGFKNAALVLSLIQLVLAGVALLGLHLKNTGGSWLYEPVAFERLEFRWPRLFGFVAVNLFVIPPLIVVYLCASLSSGISHLSSGFLHVNTAGVYVEARTYEYEDKNILLLPTAHIAQRSFYTDLIEGLPPEKTVVIPEGVSDEKKQLKDGMNYDKIAPQLGLVAQDTNILVAEHSTRYCDSDVSSFSPELVSYLNAISDFFKDAESKGPLVAYLALMSVPQPDVNQLWKEIVLDRNDLVTACIFESLETFDYVAVPWGAGHMPGIERDVLAAGAVLVNSRRVWVINWSGERDDSESDIADVPPTLRTVALVE